MRIEFHSNNTLYYIVSEVFVVKINSAADIPRSFKPFSASALNVTNRTETAHYTAMLPSYLTTLLFAISAAAAGRTAKVLGGVEANFWRITLATLFLGAYAHLLGAGISGAGFPVFLLSGCVGFGIGDIALYQALPRLGSRLSIMLVHCLATPFAAAVEWIWLGTALSGIQILSSAIILTGVALALAPGENSHRSSHDLAVGIPLVILAALGQGLGAVLSRRANLLAAAHGESIDGISAAYQRIIAGWIVAVIFLVIAKRAAANTKDNSDNEPYFKLPQQWSIIWYWILINGLAGPALGVSCYQWALATTPTGVVLPIVAITPLVVIPLSMWIEKERPSVRSLLGGAVAVLGAIALTVPDRVLQLGRAIAEGFRF